MDDIELIKSKINIVDLIQEYLPLKKAGINYKANCPFHNERTASFVVSPERQIWHCFGCSKGGDIFKFLMEKENMDFKEALEILAKKAGVTLTRTQKKDSKDKLFEANFKAQEFFHFILTKHKIGEEALKYLKKRGLTEQTIEDFGIGYAPNSWESLSKFLLKRGFTTAELINSGLAVASKTCYDRFRGRVTFPLVDSKNKIIGFSGRVLDGSEPKYINTPQTPIFDKSSYLFGINLAKGEIRAKDSAILVEGEMDVIMSHQAGIKNTVASKGTAFTLGQIELIKKYTGNVTLCFDTDLAGDSAARRGIEMLELSDINIKVVRVKGGKDPAEIIKADPKDWIKAVEEAEPIYDYYLESISSRFNTKKPEDLHKIGAELIPIWAKIQNDLVRDHYIQKLAAVVRTDEASLRQTIDKERRTKPNNYAATLSQTGRDDSIVSVHTRRELLEEYLIALLLHIPKGHQFIPKDQNYTLLTRETLKQIYVFLVLYLDSISFKSSEFKINDLIKGLPTELQIEVDRVYLTELDPRLTEVNHWQKEVDSVLSELKKALIKASLEKLSFEIKNAEAFGKMESLSTLSKRFRDLSVKLKNL